MYTELYQYLIQYKELPVPGVGTFLLERKPASVDFPNRSIEPPVYTFAMRPVSHMPDQDFFNWLGRLLQIGDRDAVFRFNDFVFDLKKQINDGCSIDWNGVGQLEKKEGGELLFTPVVITHDKPVIAKKVIRQFAEHTVRVGEDERTSVEMTEMLSQADEKKSYWWAYAATIALFGVIFIGWYFSENGVGMEAITNTTKLVPSEGFTTYTAAP